MHFSPGSHGSIPLSGWGILEGGGGGSVPDSYISLLSTIVSDWLKEASLNVICLEKRLLFLNSIILLLCLHERSGASLK